MPLWIAFETTMQKREIAFNNDPGVFPIKVRPVGIGESLDRCGGKVMNIIKGGDVKDACGSDQLCSGFIIHFVTKI